MKKKIIKEEDIQQIARECARILDNKKGNDIILIDLRKINSYLDYFLITTGNSHIHCRALAKEIQRFLKEQNIKERTKSILDSRWIILDYNEIIVHIFTRDMRDYYQIEKLWADADKIEY